LRRAVAPAVGVGVGVGGAVAVALAGAVAVVGRFGMECPFVLILIQRTL